MGFDAKQVAKMWNALAKSLRSHAKLPKNKDHDIPDYGDKDVVCRKVQEVLAVLEHLSKGTMSFSGFGQTVHFKCGVCGEEQAPRQVAKEGQRIICFNPECDASFLVQLDGEKIGFRCETCDFGCQGCGHIKHLPWRFFRECQFGERAVFDCHQCNHRNYIEWRLTQVSPGQSG